MGRVLVVAAVLGACSFEPGPFADVTLDALPGDAPPGDWWDPSWRTRIPLTITTNATLPLGFQVVASLDLDAAPCNGDLDAVRIVIGRTELPRVIDTGGTAVEHIWFRIAGPLVAGSQASDYALYCDNPSAGAPPDDPVAVFDLYETFEGGALDSGRWNTIFGTPSVTNGTLSLAPSTTGVTTVMTFPINTAVDFDLRASSAAASNPSFWGGFSEGDTFSPPWIRWVGGGAANEIRASIGDTSVTTSAVARSLDSQTHRYSVEHVSPHDASFTIARAVVDELPYGASFAMPPLSAAFVNYQSSGNIEIDMVRIRQTVKEFPDVSFGTPQGQ